jgi:hypothetical protein
LLSRGQSHPRRRAPGRRSWPRMPMVPASPVLPQVPAWPRCAQRQRGRYGSRQPEHVHQLRIGLRRLRVVLRELAPLDSAGSGPPPPPPPPPPPGWEAPLAELFRQRIRRSNDDTADSWRTRRPMRCRRRARRRLTTTRGLPAAPSRSRHGCSTRRCSRCSWPCRPMRM